MTSIAFAAETTTTLNLVDTQGIDVAVGTVRIVELHNGLPFYPDLKGLPPGQHGFHVHETAPTRPRKINGVKLDINKACLRTPEKTQTRQVSFLQGKRDAQENHVGLMKV